MSVAVALDPSHRPLLCAAVSDVASPSPTPPRASQRRPGGSLSPLQLIAERFALLDADGGYRVEGAALAGLPDRLLGLVETRSLLLHPATSYATRDVAFDWLLHRARDNRDAGGDWAVIVAGMLLPGLRSALRPMCRHNPGLVAELEAEAVAGLWAAAQRIVPGDGRVASRLTSAARWAAEKFLRAERAQRTVAEQTAADPAHRISPVDSQPYGRAGHPDLVLAAAVGDGVLSAADAELIAVTRLEDVPLCVAADWLGASYAAVKKRRIRAEARLVVWIRERQLDPAA
jgi:hypothetical protein